jgi:serine/threonine protein kinase
LPKEFARKEIIGHDAIEFVKEKTNLEWIATLQHPNLVQIQKTYQLGDKFNILFPLARTNLHEYLRFRKWGAPQGQLILTNPLWVQVVGITEALSNIIDFTDPKDPNHVIFGYHLDLKPTNILVDRSTNASEDVFKISDFGQTQFIDSAFAGTTKVVGGGAGTDAYAPPEYYEDKQDRKYDVWSLGIIFLEILAFAVRGSAGLRNPEGTGLDQVRETRENGKVNSRFYIGRGSRAALKPSISTWIEHLKRHPLIADSDSQRFTRSMLALISSMLDPNMETRHSIAKVLIDLRKILNVVAPDPKEKLPEPSKNETFLVNERYAIPSSKVTQSNHNFQGK